MELKELLTRVNEVLEVEFLEKGDLALLLDLNGELDLVECRETSEVAAIVDTLRRTLDALIG